jgi:hypothetical protein
MLGIRLWRAPISEKSPMCVNSQHHHPRPTIVSAGNSFDALNSVCCLSGGINDGLYARAPSTPRPAPSLNFVPRRPSDPFRSSPTSTYNLLTSSVNKCLRLS